MTKFYDWTRFREMTSRQKSDVTTESTFAEQREKEDKKRLPKDFGIKQLEQEVNVDWGKSIPNPQRNLQKLAVADYKGEEMKDEEASEPEPESET